MIKYQTIKCKSFLHCFKDNFLSFNWGANPYRGCEHSCPYCFARYTHEYLGFNTDKDFETKIFVKINAPEVLKKEISNLKWNHEVVNLGSVCDPYQPAEKQFEITKRLLPIFAKYKTPLLLGTKSDLILRDKKLLSKISKEIPLQVHFTITTLNENIRKIMEPRAPTTKKRIKAIKELSDLGINIGVLFMPIFPYLTDDSENINEIIKKITQAGAKSIIPGILHLRGDCKQRVFSILKKEYPKLVKKYSELYKGAYAKKEYREKIYDMVGNAETKYCPNGFEVLFELEKQLNLKDWV